MRSFSINITTFLALFFAGSFLFGQDDILDKIQPKEPSYVRRGNQAYEDERFADAMTYYLKALDHDEKSNRALFNLGDAYYQRSNFDTAANAFTRAAIEADNAQDRADAFYNAGNSQYMGEKYEEAIENYLRALQAEPEHKEARENLARAIHQMQQQQQQQQQQQKGGKGDDSDKEEEQKEGEPQDEGEEKEDGEKKEQKENKEGDQEEKKEDQKQDPKDGSDDEKDGGDEKSDQNQKKGEAGEAQDLSKTQMEALLDRLRQKEKETIQEVQKKKRGKANTREKDW